MARVVLALGSVCLLLAGPAVARTAPDGTRAARAAVPQPLTTFAISGRGWGHGVGMSQYGALGFARNGSGYAQILAHYYPGTELGQAPVGNVRVLLASGAKALVVGSAAGFAVRDGSGAVHELEPGTVRFGPGLRLKLSAAGPAEPLPGPLLFSARGAPLELAGKAYRGALRVAVEQGRLSAVNHVGLEAYLFGVVPREVPAHWPAEALNAQAVVARSYALSSRRTGGAFDLYADVRSQVYGGMEAEKPATTAAVLATRGQVLLFEGSVARTFFFSTSGGRTAAAEEVWSGDPVPYLVSVPDPYDNLSPYHAWGPVSVPAAKVRTGLRLPAAPVDLRTTATPSGRVGRLQAILPDGRELSVPASTARFGLGLRSTWFRVVGSLTLQPPPRRVVTFGAKVRLAGAVRGLDAPALQQRRTGEPWSEVAALSPAEDGSFALTAAPKVTTLYRLVAGRATGATLRVSVAPRVRLLASAAPGTLEGTVRPVLPGATVLIQRLDGSWRTVARATVDDAGSFAAPLDLVPGAYRARIAPRGYAVGLSPVLQVSG